jgi:hypothetical protein
MRKPALSVLCSGLALLGSSALAGPIGLVDDFGDTSLAEYTQTVVLDNNAVRGVTFSSPSGVLQSGNVDTTPEQSLLLRNDRTLAVGETLKVDALVAQQAIFGDIGIAVAGSATPGGVASGASGDVRTAANYVFIAVRENGDLTNTGDRVNGATFTAGNANTTQIANITHDLISGLYISRLAPDQFVAGWIDNSNNLNQVFAVTISGSNAVGIGNAIGFYTDVRANGSYGNLDNLRIVQGVPEPASLGLVLAGGLGLLRRRRDE